MRTMKQNQRIKIHNRKKRETKEKQKSIKKWENWNSITKKQNETGEIEKTLDVENAQQQQPTKKE